MEECLSSTKGEGRHIATNSVLDPVPNTKKILFTDWSVRNKAMHSKFQDYSLKYSVFPPKNTVWDTRIWTHLTRFLNKLHTSSASAPHLGSSCISDQVARVLPLTCLQRMTSCFCWKSRDAFVHLHVSVCTQPAGEICMIYLFYQPSLSEESALLCVTL